MASYKVRSFTPQIATKRGFLVIAPILIVVGLLFSTSSSDSFRPGQLFSAARAKDASHIELAQVATESQRTRLLGTSQKSQAFTPEQRAELGGIIRDYLLANPELLLEISEELQRRQQVAQSAEQGKILASHKATIFNSPLDFVLGDENGDVTIVEYFDYNCGWCKRALNEVTELTKSDPKLRVVLKEFPIFGEHSEFAARAALASKAQGKYWDFHVALMKERRVTKDNTLQIAARVGIDIEKLKSEMAHPKYQKAIEQTQKIATSLGIEGTPGFIIDGAINPGYLPADQMRPLIADIRKKGCQFC
ncbi:MAG: DsbA family protein [Hyphomicrobiaceae bacterium]